MTYVPPDSIPQTKPVDPLRTKPDVHYALLIAEDQAAVSQGFRWPIVKCDANGYLTTSRPPNSGVTFSKFTAADGTTTPKRLDIGFLGANRDMVTIVNTSDKDVFVNLGFTVSATSVTRILGPYIPAGNPLVQRNPCQWDVPLSSPFYGGAIWGMWPVATNVGGIICTELT